MSKIKEGNRMKHYITKYEEKGVKYAEAWIQISILGKCLCLSRKKIRI